MDIKTAISVSDDIDKYESVFIQAAEQAVEKGWLTIDQIEGHGGWVRSTAFPGYYFISPTVLIADMVYLDIKNKRIGRQID